MGRVQLFSPTGALVTELTIPTFSVYPEVIRWGARTFHLVAGRYVECFCYDSPVLVGSATAA